MAFENKPNTGALFVNNEKLTEKYPDFRGDLHLDKTFLIEQMNNANGALVKISLSVWNAKAKSGLDYMTIVASAPWVPQEEKLPY